MDRRPYDAIQLPLPWNGVAISMNEDAVLLIEEDFSPVLDARPQLLQSDPFWESGRWRL